MDKLKYLLTLVIGAALLAVLASTSIAAADTVEFTINNKTSRTLEFTFLGEETYVVTAPPGKTRFDAVKGTYQLSYYDCGQLNISTIKITNKNNELKIEGCTTDAGGSTGGVLNTVELVINNKSGKTLEITLLGEKNYFVTATSGKHRLDVIKGTYQMSYYDCGQLNISNVAIKREDTEIKILTCAQIAAGADPVKTGGEITLGTKVPKGSVVFVINNKTDRPTTFSLISPVEVTTYNALLGRTKVVVPIGEYGYAYYACGRLWTGTIRIRKTSDEIVLTPCGQNQGRPDEGNNISFKLKNNTGEQFYISLEGPQDYYLFVRSRNSQIFKVEKGFYSYSIFACGQTFGGTVFLKDGVTLKTPYCRSP